MSKQQQKLHPTIRPFYPDAKAVPSEAKNAPLNTLSHKVQESQGEDLEAARHNLLWKLMSSYIPAEKDSVQLSFVNHMEYTLARSRFNLDAFSSYLAASYSVRDRLIELFNDTQEYFISSKAKQVYYVSAEFLVGRFLRNALLNLELEDLYRKSLAELDVSLDQAYNEEYDPGLGNGGLGRLAACFMDSLATLNLPGWGYGLMYSFGMFKQMIGPDGSQMEIPDYWLNFGDPWRIQKPTVTHQVHFYGRSENGVWKPSLTINAVANDFLIPGFGTDNTLGLRLWSSKPTVELDEEKFRGGDYFQAISMKQRCENLTSVLYPNDNTYEGKEMRLMQEYFMSSASLQDIIRRLKTQQREDIRQLPKYAAIQLNDTHPTVMVAELLRILMDEEDMGLVEALEITRKVFSYTCHTLMPEALEKWDIPLFQNMLPRHMEIIYQLNQHYLDEVRAKYHVSDEVIRNLSIIEESNPKRVRMANLAVIGSHMVNGVAAIHSELMKQYVFKDFYTLEPKKFINKTNGVTVRRWLHHCNPELSRIITRVCGDEKWALNAEGLTALRAHQDDPNFIAEWESVKLANKQRLAELVKKTTGVELNAEKQLFDIQVKRIHEYKRQQLNIFSIIYRYLNILEMTPAERAKLVPRAMIFGGKAAPGYYTAKKLIKLINNVAKVINADKNIGDLLKVVFIPNYNVSAAEIIIPGTDVCEQISTAGTEASGTSNMKFAFNGGLIIGTHDGANIEIGDAIGNENVFFFGEVAENVDAYRAAAEHPIPAGLRRVFDTIRTGLFGDVNEYECLMYPVEHGDNYLVAKDFDDYIDAQRRCDEAYKNKEEWTKMCIASTANMARFSSDRTIAEYAKEVWGIKECKLPVVEPIEASGVTVQQMGVGSIGGSLRRHQSAAISDAPAQAPAAPTLSKGTYGSLSRKSQIPVPQPAAQPETKDDDHDGEIPIDFN
uniref:Alpha-1,4 glucan phosphorylase n=1 Tax=Trichomonas tenax TaxID=43075 RepID=F6ME10_9EUKA|nr:glycogen phosphorylase [Trichomonas tenax]